MRTVIVIVFLMLAGSSAFAFTPQLPTDGSDARPAFDAAIDQLCNPASQDRILQLPAGTFNFYTQPKAIACALTVIGQGKGATTLIRQFAGGSYFLMWTRGLDQSGGGVREIQLEAGANTDGGIAIYLQAIADPDANSNSLNRHSFTIDNVLIGRYGSPSSWDVGIYLDGTQNPLNNIGVAPGIRVPFITRTTISGTRQACIYANEATGTHAQVECYSLGGQFATNVILRGAITDSFVLDCRSACVPSWADNLAHGLIYNNVPTGPQ